MLLAFLCLGQPSADELRRRANSWLFLYYCRILRRNACGRITCSVTKKADITHIDLKEVLDLKKVGSEFQQGKSSLQAKQEVAAG